jgi:hypothetical protein
MNTERHLIASVDRQLRALRAKDRQLSAPTRRALTVFAKQWREATDQERKEFAILFMF